MSFDDKKTFPAIVQCHIAIENPRPARKDEE
jgi:hypothetical protein